MPATPHRVAQTSTEAKKQHKKNGPLLPERQQKQLERAFELDQRAARIHDAEERRRAAKKKRGEREEKEARARKQIGVGLATQLAGYSHTQAQLKSGMEAFLGVKKRQEEEKRRKEVELAKKLETIVENMDKEPWDDDETDDIVLDLPELHVSSGEQWMDDELDDDSLLEAHDLVMSDPIDEPRANAPPPPAPASPVLPATMERAPIKEDTDFVRTHGPINKTIESVLDKLPEPLIEFLSQDLSMKLLDWDPELSLLHKLNPIGLPPHRLRIKVGCAVTLLRDLNTSSQLSKSQHLQVLRAESERLECLVLDGQLEGTKTFLTRVAFTARYRNQDQYPFQRTQFPIRVAVDYTPSSRARDTSQSGFKLPSIPGHVRPSGVPKRQGHRAVKSSSQIKSNPVFKLPGLPASKSSCFIPSKPAPPVYIPSMDSWDDFLESGTQIARELAVEAVPISTSVPKTAASQSPLMADCFPPLSTQDFDFSLEDLDEEPSTCATNTPSLKSSRQIKTIPTKGRTPSAALSSTVSVLKPSTRPVIKPPRPKHPTAEFKPSMPPLSQKPPSVSDRPGLKRKTWTAPRHNSLRPPKRPCIPSYPPSFPAIPTVSPKSHGSFNDFPMSTQEAASFFDDDDSLTFGSPPIAT